MSIRHACIASALALALIARGAAAEEPAKAPAKAEPAGKPWHEGKQIKEEQVVEGLKVRAFGDRVYFAGQPKMEHFKEFAAKGVKTVVNLRAPEEQKGVDEKAAVEAAGMKYIQIPIGKDEPKPEELERIMKAIDGAEKEPTLVHCASSIRVGYAWAVYRGTRCGLAEGAAIEEGQQAGMQAPNLLEWAKRAIEKKK